MRCSGLSLWRLSAPYFAVGAACGGLLFLVNEILMPDSVDRAERMLNQPSANAEWQWQQPFFSFADGRTNVIGPFEFNSGSGEMRKALVVMFPPAGGRLEIKAERGVYSNGCWHFHDVQQNIYRPGELVPKRETTNHLAVPVLKDPPDRIRSESKIASMSDLKAARGMSLSLREILEYRRWHPERRSDPQLDTKFHVRLAAPATCLVIVLVAIPFGARSGRRNVFVGVATSIVFAFCYFVIQRFAEAAGMGGKIAPWLAGWLPNLVFAVAGIIMTSRTR
jgi:lipopolysaccharide export system permease protein